MENGTSVLNPYVHCWKRWSLSHYGKKVTIHHPHYRMIPFAFPIFFLPLFFAKFGLSVMQFNIERTESDKKKSCVTIAKNGKGVERLVWLMYIMCPFQALNPYFPIIPKTIEWQINKSHTFIVYPTQSFYCSISLTVIHLFKNHEYLMKIYIPLDDSTIPNYKTFPYFYIIYRNVYIYI